MPADRKEPPVHDPAAIAQDDGFDPDSLDDLATLLVEALTIPFPAEDTGRTASEAAKQQPPSVLSLKSRH